MLLTLFSTAALAEDSTTLYVAGTQITESGYWKNDGNGGITQTGADESSYNVYFDGKSTLTLKDAQITQSYTVTTEEGSVSTGIYCDSDLKIALIGNNTIGSDAMAEGIHGAETMALKGDGTLNISVNSDDCSHGIYSLR